MFDMSDLTRLAGHVRSMEGLEPFMLQRGIQRRFCSRRDREDSWCRSSSHSRDTRLTAPTVIGGPNVPGAHLPRARRRSGAAPSWAAPATPVQFPTIPRDHLVCTHIFAVLCPTRSMYRLEHLPLQIRAWTTSYLQTRTVLRELTFFCAHRHR